MSRAAELKKKGKESVFARRRREKEELDEMLRRNEEEATKEVEKKMKAEEAGKKADEKADEAVKEIAEEVKSDQKSDREKLNAIKRPPSNKELSEQIGGNTEMIRELTGQIGDLAGGVKMLVGTVTQHDQVLANHGRRISALEKEVGILDRECYPEPERVAEPEPEPMPVQRKAEEPEAKPSPKTEAKQVSHFGYLYFPVDKTTGKTRWDLPFRSAVDAADCNVSCSWKRRLFLFNPEGQVLREATPEEASRFSCA